MLAAPSGNDVPDSAVGDEPVAIQHYARGFDAALAAAALESHGIAAEVLGDMVCDTLNWYGLAVRKVELVVPRRRAAEARKILEELSASRAETQRPDWVCSDCGEVNGSEFDSCWSCSKCWSAEHDQEFVAETIAQPLPSASDPVHSLPEPDMNPYAPPVSGTVVEAAPGAQVELEIRRAFRSLIFSQCFPPLAFYTFYIAAQTLSRVGRNEISASPKQRRRLQWILIATVFTVPVFLFGLHLLQQNY